MEIKGMMQLHGGGRMEEKHKMCDVHVCGSIAMHCMEMKVWSLNWLDKIRWEKENWLSPLN